MRIKINGLDELKTKLESMKQNIKELEGPHPVPLSELFTESFLSKNTKFASYSEFEEQPIFQQYPSLNVIPEKELDDFVAGTTKFSNWDEMCKTATLEYIERKIGF